MNTLSLTLWACGAAVVSFAAALIFTPLARLLAQRIGAVDHPDGGRKLQRQPVALLGGVAVLGGLGLTVAVAVMLGWLHDSGTSIAQVSSGLALLCAVGVYDDLHNLRAKWKLFAQIATAIPILIAGCEISGVKFLGFEMELGAASFLIGMAWLVACTNAVNLIDGMDGLCSTVALCVAAGVVVLGCGSGATHTVVCAAALSGSLAGFLFYNRPPATIYLGDAGSMVVGMTLAMLTMQVARDSNGMTHPAIMVSLMAVPLGDVLLAMIRRRLSGKSIWHPDRGHIHHRLLDHGLRVPQALAVVASICLITTALR
jgi:UDP-GlcNAc:undecaprenyl-phosphate GlcNAc-1-phosphate transferase